MKDIYEMTIHETIDVCDFWVTRVPGGWIYRFIRLDFNTMSCVFVPINLEFDPPGNDQWTEK